jgi:hypothetical protein
MGTKVPAGTPTSVPGVVVAGYDRLGNEIRAFNDSGLQSQIDRAVASLKPNSRGAIVAVGNLDEQRLAVIMRPFKSDSFSVVGTLAHTGTTDWKAWRPEIAIRKEF